MKITIPLIATALLIPVFSLAQTPQMTARAAGRLLEQATWGPTPSALSDAETKGLTGWLNEQFAAPPSPIPFPPVVRLGAKTDFDLSYLQRAFFQNAVNGPDQLRQRVAFALSEIWVISGLEVRSETAFSVLMTIFRDNAFGNYRDILKDVTLNPGMGRFLNMVNNNKGNPAKNTSPNENYAREVMQLFTLGIYQLNADGTPVLDAQGVPVPAYDQTTVDNMAKVLTGWTYAPLPRNVSKSHNPDNFALPMIAVEANHDTSAKTLFGATLPAGQSAEADLDAAFDLLMQQPSMAPFVSKQLIQHLVTSNPSGAYVTRVSAVFNNNGSGVQGDLKAVVTAILTDPEARAGDDDLNPAVPGFGHLREPVLFLTGMLRGLNATVGPTSTIYQRANALTQNVFFAPSVFSYFSPQYRTATGLPAPEFQLYSTQTATTRINIVSTALYGSLDAGTVLNLAPFVALGGNEPQLADSINSLFFHQAMSSDLQNAIAQAVSGATSPLDAARSALYVALTSGEYQVIH